MDFTTDYRTERYALNTRWGELPADIQTRALMCSIDLMGALILGSYGGQYAAGAKLAQLMSLSGEIPVVGDDRRFNLLGAAVAMGHSSNSFDIDDGYNMIKGHPGTSFVAGVLAAALANKVSYREYLTTLVVCYEITIRWALVMQEHYGFLHSTGTYGAFGTALGVSRLMGLDEKAMNNALSIADFHAPLTPVMRAVEYPSMNKDGVPFGALTGTMAVLETLCGSTGKTHLLELPQGAAYLDTLGQKYYMRELYFKPYTCCRWAHQPISACLELMKEHCFTHEEVAKVKVNTFAAAAKLSKICPRDTDEAQYNIAFPVASALVHGDVGYLQICDEALHDQDVLEMMQRLTFEMDPEMEKCFPEQRLAWVEITLNDGTVYCSNVFAAPGEHTDPELNLDWICKKFRRITAPMLEEKDQENLLGLLMAPAEDIAMNDIVMQLNHMLRPKGRLYDVGLQ